MALARIAPADPVIAQIVALPHLDIPNFEQMPNTNDMLGTGGVNGLKTGTLEAAAPTCCSPRSCRSVWTNR